MKAILVTGVDGLVGHEVAAVALSEGSSVLGIGRRSEASFRHPNFEYVSLDLTRSDLPAFEPQPLAILHLAAELPQDHTQSREVAQRNLAMDRRVLGWCLKQKVPLVYASSTSVYGDRKGPLSPKISESFAVSPPGAYSEAKHQFEGEAHRAMLSEGLRFLALRLCAPYGLRQTSRTVLKIFIERALAGQPLGVYGSGNREQSFLHARDAARAFFYGATQGEGLIHLASTKPTTMKELAQIVLDCAGRPSEPIVRLDGEDPQEGVVSRFDLAKAKRELDWEPIIGLKQGIQDWMMNLESQSCDS